MVVALELPVPPISLTQTGLKYCAFTFKKKNRKIISNEKQRNTFFIKRSVNRGTEDSRVKIINSVSPLKKHIKLKQRSLFLKQFFVFQRFLALFNQTPPFMEF